MITITQGISAESKRIADHYGLIPEGDQLIEECGELIQAMIKHRRYRDAVTAYHIFEEIADVLAVIERYIYLFGADPDQLADIIREKTERELYRIGGGEDVEDT